MMKFTALPEIEESRKSFEAQSKLYNTYADTVISLHDEWNTKLDNLLSEYQTKIKESNEQFIDFLVEEMTRKCAEISNVYISKIKEYLEKIDNLDIIDIKGMKLSKSFYLDTKKKDGK